MSERSEGSTPALQDLSALADGELDPAAVAAACRAWRADEHVRSQWHTYHLIGDVMRSEDLASDASRDAAFLLTLRQRLADEPVVLAPAASATGAEAPGSVRHRRSWAAPVAVAAGFVVVAGALVVTQMAGGLSFRGEADSSIAKAPSALQPVALADGAAAPASEAAAVVINGQLVRDVRLDEYLAAHKRFGGSSLPGGPSGFLRNAAVEVPAR